MADAASPPDGRAGARRVAALVGVWAVVTGAVAAFAGCYPHNCDGDVIVWGRNTGEGRFVTPDAWESSPVDGDWIPFSRERTIYFDMRDERTPIVFVPYISAEVNPNRDSNFTIGAGNIAEILAVGPGRFAVKNDTCADYYIRVVAETSARPPAVDPKPPVDASTGDAEAGP